MSLDTQIFKHVSIFTFGLDLWGDYLIEPFDLPARRTGLAYLDFLQNTLSGWLEAVPFVIV